MISDEFRIEMKKKIFAPVTENDSKLNRLLEHLPFDYSGNKLTKQYTSSATILVN